MVGFGGVWIYSCKKTTQKKVDNNPKDVIIINVAMLLQTLGDCVMSNTIKLDIGDISDELYDALLAEFRAVAAAKGIDFDHTHWVVEAYVDAETYEENDWLDDQADELNGAFGDIVIDES